LGKSELLRDWIESTSVLRLIARLLVDNGEAVGEVSVARDVLDANLLIVVERAHDVPSPDIGDLNLLLGAGHHTQVLKVEHELRVRDLVPVDDESCSIATGQRCCVSLRSAPELRPPVTADHTSRLPRVNILVNTNDAFVLKDSEGLRSNSDQITSNNQGCLGE